MIPRKNRFSFSFKNNCHSRSLSNVIESAVVLSIAFIIRKEAESTQKRGCFICVDLQPEWIVFASRKHALFLLIVLAHRQSWNL
ncbi:hypothetical protein P4V43_09520 [Brevibacillus fortis]|uniref:hypothetical protein n=1 Tax=Brevibacillus fortis TaxID=2126352 RepID=UPI002E21480B|nr:hypothetical protein [Brevibacillus fortis]